MKLTLPWACLQIQNAMDSLEKQLHCAQDQLAAEQEAAAQLQASLAQQEESAAELQAALAAENGNASSLHSQLSEQRSLAQQQQEVCNPALACMACRTGVCHTALEDGRSTTSNERRGQVCLLVLLAVLSHLQGADEGLIIML